MANDANYESDAAEGQPIGQRETGDENTSVAGLGLDGSTPLEAGIEGRLTHAGGHRETESNERDWQVHVDVDQPVQQVEI